MIGAYQHAIDRLVAEKGYQSWDVISMRADNPQRRRCAASFSLNIPTVKMKYASLSKGRGCSACILTGIFFRSCAKNDLISVPAGTPHWFDMGSSPHFTAIRIFDNQEGWIAKFTGDPIADGYPRLP